MPADAWPKLPKELKVIATLRSIGVRARGGRAAWSRRRPSPPALTALMILLFLGSWRSTLIVVVSIPLSILVSIIVLASARPDAERDDARRHGARGRHPGRRRDGRDREHPPQHGARESRSSARSSTARRRSRCRRSSRRCASASCSCRSSFITGAAKSLFVPLATGGRVRDADVVLPVADAGADAGAVPAREGGRGALPRGTHGAPRSRSSGSSRLSIAASSGLRTGYGRWLALGAFAPRAVRVRLLGLRAGRAWCSWCRCSVAISFPASMPV